MRTAHSLTVSRSIQSIEGGGVCPTPLMQTPPRQAPQMQTPPDADPPDADPQADVPQADVPQADLPQADPWMQTPRMQPPRMQTPLWIQTPLWTEGMTDGPKFKAKLLSLSVYRSLTTANSNDKAISLFTLRSSVKPLLSSHFKHRLHFSEISFSMVTSQNN